MALQSAIEWTASTWNPVTGCTTPQVITHDVPATAPDGQPLAWHGIGNPELLAVPDKAALFASRRCDGNVILALFDRTRELRDAGRVVVGGFQSPVEKECLAILLRSPRSRLIILPARGLAGLRIPQAWRAPLAASRLLRNTPSTLTPSVPPMLRLNCSVEVAIPRSFLGTPLCTAIKKAGIDNPIPTPIRPV